MHSLLQITFQAGMLAGLVWLTQQALGRWLPPRAHYALWFLVLIRLLLWTPLADPFSIERPDWWTLSTGVAPTLNSELDLASRQISQSDGGFVQVGHGGSGTKVALSKVAQTPRAAKSKIEIPAHTRASKYANPTRTLRTAPTSTPLTEPRILDLAPSQDAITSNWWLVIWGIGAALFFLRSAFSEIYLRRQLAKQALPAPAGAQELVSQCQQLIHFPTAIKVMETDLVPSPAAYGLIRPKILLPLGTWENLSKGERELVILHELAHLKHKDAWSNWLMAVLQAAHWFNPMISFAFSRLRTEREIVRDREAIQARPGVEPTQYAATILKMLPRSRSHAHRSSLSAMATDRKTTSKRITMILQNKPFRKSNVLLGALCFALLGWAGLTSAAALGASNSDNAAGINEALAKTQSDFNASVESRPSNPQHIRVTRQTEEPEWRIELNELLDQKVQWPKEISDLDDWVDWVNEWSGFSLKVDSDYFDGNSEVFRCNFTMPLRDALDLLCWQYSYHWSLTPNGIYISDRENLRGPLDLRFYDIRPLVHGNADLADHLMNISESLLPGVDVWGREGTNIRYWDGQLLVRQCDKMHSQLQEILELLSTGSDAKQTPNMSYGDSWLDLRVDLEEDDYTPYKLMELLSKQTELPILMEEGFDDIEIHVEAKDATLRAVFEILTQEYGFRAQPWKGGICVGYNLPIVRQTYAIEDLIQPSQELVDGLRNEINVTAEDEGWDAQEAADWLEERVHDERAGKMETLEDLIYSLVETQSWDNLEGSGLDFWGDVMMISQTPATHVRIETFLDAARRAIQ